MSVAPTSSRVVAGLSLVAMNPVSATQWIRARRWLSYPIAIALSLLALWARLQLGGLFVQSPFLLFMVAVALSAFLGGVGPGLVAAILSGLLAD
jgi:K+-sensing histidine kinase KdpD